MDTLHITVDFHPDETFTSFVSRLAAANGATSAQSFCQDMGLHWQALVDGEAVTVTRLLELCGKVSQAHAAGIAVRDERSYSFGREVLLRSNLSRLQMKVCPHCLDEDDATGRGPSGSRAYGRLVWMPAFVRTCRVHKCLLVPLPEPAGFSSPHDFAARARLAKTEWTAFHAGARPAHPSDFEAYVSDRMLAQTRTPNWLDKLPLYAAGKLTEMIGATLTHGRSFVTADLSNEEWLEAGRQGFEITSKGLPALSDFLRSLHDRFWNSNGDFGGRAIYGRLYELLAHENEDPAYDVVRELMRETAVASLPIGPDHPLFGVASSRRWHSVHSATKEFGLHHKTARKMFAAAGLIPEEELAADSRTLVEADKMETFIRRWQSCLKTDAAMLRLNIGRSSWEIILREGYVRPLIPNFREQGVAPLFPKDEIDAFKDRLLAAAPVATWSRSNLVNLTTATKKLNSRLATVMELLLDHQLESAITLPDEAGFGGVWIDVGELRDLL